MKIRTQLDAAGQIPWVSGDGGTRMNQNEALKVITSLKAGVGNPDIRALKVRTALKAGIQDSEDLTLTPLRCLRRPPRRLDA